MSSANITVLPRRLSHAYPKAQQCRRLSQSARCMVNPLLNLSHFSASKEAQFFSKERRIPREEFVPHIQLIRSSEVDPFAPAPGASPSVVAALKRAQQGQSDMQTTYSLAISNLSQQVLVLQADALQARATLSRIHDKYKREERNSFLVMISTIALLSLILAKTDALEELKEYALQVGSRWKGFEWEWLGNPPSYKNSPRTKPPGQQQVISPLVIATPNGTPLGSVDARPDQRITIPTSSPPQAETSQPSRRWTLSRLFWAAPA